MVKKKLRNGAKEVMPTHKVKYPLSVPGRKKRWVQIGVGWRTEDGTIACRVESLPLGGWDGTLYLFRATKKAH